MSLDNNNHQTKEDRLDRIFDFDGITNSALTIREQDILSVDTFMAGLLFYTIREPLTRFQSLIDDYDISDDDIIHALERAENRVVAPVPQGINVKGNNMDLVTTNLLSKQFLRCRDKQNNQNITSCRPWQLFLKTILQLQ